MTSFRRHTLVAGLLLSAVSLRAQMVLRYEGAAGTVVDYDITSDYTMVATPLNVEERFDTDVRTRVRLTVADVLMKRLTVDLRPGAVRVHTRSSRTIADDPTTGETTDSTRTLPASTAPYRVVMTPRGTVLATGDADGSPVTTIPNLVPLLLIEYPERAIGIGTSWSVLRRDTMAFGPAGSSVETTMKTVYTPSRLVDTLGLRCVELALTGSSLRLTGSIDLGTARMTVSGRGTVAGRVLVDTASGFVVAATMTSAADGEMVVDGQDTVLVPVTIESTLTIRRP